MKESIEHVSPFLVAPIEPHVLASSSAGSTRRGKGQIAPLARDDGQVNLGAMA
jgi:hypothetical protein